MPCALLAAAGVAWILSVSLHGAPREPRMQDPASNSPGFPPGGGAQIVRVKCLSCHAGDLIVQQRLSRTGWSGEVDKMVGWGAVVDASERDTLLDYLTAYFSGSSLPRARDGSDRPAASIVETRCLTCHDARLIEQQRLTRAGWTGEVEKMIGWGASLTETEKAALIEYLAPALSIPTP